MERSSRKASRYDTGAILGPAPIGSEAAGPRSGLLVEIAEIAKGSRGEEGVTHVANGALDAPFLVAARGGDGSRRKAVMRSELEEPRMEADGVALALENGALEIVVEEDARRAAESVEGIDVTA